MIKAVMYTTLGALMTWCWMMGHSFWWHIAGFTWAALFAVDVVKFAFPKQGGWK